MNETVKKFLFNKDIIIFKDLKGTMSHHSGSRVYNNGDMLLRSSSGGVIYNYKTKETAEIIEIIKKKIP